MQLMFQEELLLLSPSTELSQKAGAWMFYSHGPKGPVVCSKGIISVWQQTQEAVSEKESKDMSYPGPALLATPSLGDYQE